MSVAPKCANNRLPGKASGASLYSLLCIGVPCPVSGRSSDSAFFGMIFPSPIRSDQFSTLLAALAPSHVVCIVQYKYSTPYHQHLCALETGPSGGVLYKYITIRSVHAPPQLILLPRGRHAVCILYNLSEWIRLVLDASVTASTRPINHISTGSVLQDCRVRNPTVPPVPPVPPGKDGSSGSNRQAYLRHHVCTQRVLLLLFLPPAPPPPPVYAGRQSPFPK